jgi:spermidine/putrescine transport system permease protein
MRLYAAFIYLFLYFLIAIIVFFSFNAGRYAMDWQGFSLAWYATAWNNPFVMEALKNSMITAGGTSILSVIIGTAAALGIERVRNGVVSYLSACRRSRRMASTTAASRILFRGFIASSSRE